VDARHAEARWNIRSVHSRTDALNEIDHLARDDADGGARLVCAATTLFSSNLIELIESYRSCSFRLRRAAIINPAAPVVKSSSVEGSGTVENV
jgi:hypothetical protein